jgi:hypothetical protein
MPQWTLNYLSDGQQPLASGLTTLFTDAKATIDAPTAKEIRRGAFNRFHGGHVVGGMDDANNYDIRADHGIHLYAFSVFGAYLQYSNATDYGVNGGTFSGGGAGTTTWVSIGHPNATGPYVGAGGPEFLIVFDDQFRLDGGLTGECFGIRGVELGLNIEVHEIIPGDGSTATNVLFCIQYRTVESATWITIDRTIRSFSVDDRVRVGAAVTEDPDFDASIRSLFTVADLAVSTDRIHSFRAMCALEAGAGGLVADDTLSLRFGNFTAVPIRCEVDNQ